MHDGNKVPAGLEELAADFEILGQLGRGGMAVVYHARERKQHLEVALKVIRARYAEDEEIVARFAREARTLTRLKHPNIVSTLEVRALNDGSLALVMQYVPGPTLRQLIQRRGPLPFDRTEQVLCDIGRALAYAHRRHIVHRDVKPDNIFLTDETGTALLSDFGIAKSHDSDEQLTMTGVALGTPAYMSPEQIDSVVVDGRSDIYSLGLVGWEMLTGRRPWEGETLFGVLYKQKHEKLPPLRELRPDIPARLELAMEGALLKDPSRRWADMGDFLAQMTPGASDAPIEKARAAERRRQQVVANVSVAREEAQLRLRGDDETVRFVRADRPQRTPPSTPAWKRAARHSVAAAAGILLLAGGAAVMAAGGSRGPGAALQPAATQGLVEQHAGGPGFPAYLLPPEEPASGTVDAADVEMNLALMDEAPPSAHDELARTSWRAPPPASARERSRAEREAMQPQPEPPPARLQLASTALEASPSPPAAPRLLHQPSTSGAFRAPPADEGPARTAARRECASNPFDPNTHRRARAACALQLAMGESLQLTVTAGPLAWRTQAVQHIGWRSSNPAIATVDENGVVRAVTPGRVTMTATAPGMGGTATIIVTAPSEVP